MPFRKDFIKEYKKMTVKLKFFLRLPKKNINKSRFFERHYGIAIA
jgi:hypothetical protein